MKTNIVTNNFKKVSIIGLTALLVVSGFFINATAVSAATSGPMYPSSVVNDTSIGTEPWVYPERAKTNNNEGAQNTIDDTHIVTNYLKASGFGFSIPVGATINGIEVIVERSQNNSFTTRVKDNSVRLVKNGTIVPSSEKSTSIGWPDTYGTITYGSPTDKWGQTWTAGDINNVNTGFAISAKYEPSDGARDPRVDYISMTVYYTPDTTPPVIAPHENITATADSLGGATVNYTLPTATDNVDPVVTVTCLPAPGSYFTIAGSPHIVTCNATDTAGNPAIPTTFTVTVTPDSISASQSTIVFDNSGQISTNGGTANFTVTAKDQYGNTIPGASVVLSATGSNNTFTPPNPGITNSSGQAQMGLQSTKAEAKIVSVTIGGVLLSTTIPVTFIPGAPAYGQISASTTTPEASLTGTTVDLTITVTDASGNLVQDNTTVALLTDFGIIDGSGNTVNGVVTRNLTGINKGTAHLTFSGLTATGDTIINFVDTTIPVITRIGDETVSVEYRGTYTDDGATASDNIDGDITGSIVTVNLVNTNFVMFNPALPGQIVATYTVTYDVSDLSGNPADQVTRTVNVIDTTKPVITLIVSDATSPGVLKIGDTIIFTLTPTPAEPIATFSSFYNGHDLSLLWSTADGGVTYTATYTVTEGDADQTSPLQITGVTMTDEAGNVSDPVDGTDVQKTIDAHRPIVVSVDSDGETYNLATSSPHTIKITFNEDILNVPLVGVNIVPEPQTVTDCGDGDAKTFCFDYTIVVPQEMTHTIYISDAQDMAGNVMTPNPDSTHTFIVDTVSPVLSETTPVTDPTNDPTPDYIFNSSEAGTITYGGSCSSSQTAAVNGDNAIIFNFLADGTYSDCTIVVTDAAGNTSLSLSVAPFTVDTGNPTVTISSTAPDPTNVKPIPVTVAFSEPVSDFGETDVVVTNGTIDLGSFAGSGTDYSFNVTPTGSDPETIKVFVDIAADVAHDVAGNGNEAATTLSRVYDTEQPTVVSVILQEGGVASDYLVKAGDILTVNVEFSEDMTMFPASQISITGANTLSATDMIRADATHYTYDFTVGSGDGTATITIANGQDLAGNPQVVDSSTTFTVDNTLPVIDSHDPIVEVANATGGKFITYTVTASDTHDGPIVPTCTPPSGSFFPVSQTTPVTCNATDQAGNAAEPMIFTVTINPDVITHIVLIASPLSLAFDSTSLITVTGKDQYENVVTNNNSTVIVLSADGGGSLDNTILTLSAGVKTTYLSKDSAGIVHVTASSDGLTPQEVTVEFTEVDISSPFVESHTPVNGAENVSVNIHPVLVFDEPLDTTTVSSDNIQLRKYSDNSPVPASVSPAEGDRQAIITPVSPLDFSTQYYFAVSANVTDKVGNPAIVLDEGTKGSHSFTTVADTTILSVTGISAVKTYATADGTYENGWSWIFYVTVPTSETELQMKFDDWTSALNTIPVANNIRYSSAQASNGPIEITAANTYGDALLLIDDLDSGTPGRQIQILVEAKIPEGSAGGSYSTSYGIKSSP